jgi:hypothetical protein
VIAEVKDQSVERAFEFYGRVIAQGHCTPPEGTEKNEPAVGPLSLKLTCFPHRGLWKALQ